VSSAKSRTASSFAEDCGEAVQTSALPTQRGGVGVAPLAPPPPRPHVAGMSDRRTQFFLGHPCSERIGSNNTPSQTAILDLPWLWHRAQPHLLPTLHSAHGLQQAAGPCQSQLIVSTKWRGKPVQTRSEIKSAVQLNNTPLKWHPLCGRQAACASASL
jgi:hypothetical protein